MIEVKSVAEMMARAHKLEVSSLPVVSPAAFIREYTVTRATSIFE